MSVYTAFRFNHPDFDAALGRPGMTLDPSGQLATVGSRAAVRQAILLLLSTRPGERIMHPDYGCSLHHLVFGPNDDTTAGLAAHYVRTALARWEPRIELLAVLADSVHEPAEQLEIVVDYRVRANLQREQLLYALPLQEPER